MWLLEICKLHTWPASVAHRGRCWSGSIKSSQPRLSASRAFRLGMPSVNPVLPASSENARCRRPEEGGGGSDEERGQDWPGLQAASYPMHQQGGQEDALHQGVATDRSALRRAHRGQDTVRPARPHPGPGKAVPSPAPTAPTAGALLPGRFPDLLICVPLPGLLLDLRPCFSKGSAASSSPGPQGVASASITKLCDKKCGPLIKIM